jgi:hypothetical protein
MKRLWEEPEVEILEWRGCLNADEEDSKSFSGLLEED